MRARLLPLVDFLDRDNPDARRQCLLARAAGQYPWVAGPERLFSAELTQYALVVEVAGGTRVPLGRPDDLQPIILPTLAEVVEVQEQVVAGAANRPVDWVDLGYRLGFIAQYFAAYQQNVALTQLPPNITLRQRVLTTIRRIRRRRSNRFRPD